MNRALPAIAAIEEYRFCSRQELRSSPTAAVLELPKTVEASIGCDDCRIVGSGIVAKNWQLKLFMTVALPAVLLSSERLPAAAATNVDIRP